MNKRAAVIGTGIMGTGMGKTLLRDGWSVSCYNRTRENAEDLVSSGAVFFDTPSKAASSADFVVLMPWDVNALKSMLEGDEGLFSNAARGQIFIDMSTQLPETALWEAEGFSGNGAEFLDAPVHGTKGEANGGGLWIMAGGKRDVYDKTIPLLAVLGETHHYMGEHGKGFAAKLCGNHLVSTLVAALGESMVLADKAGIDRKELLKLWMESDFRSPVVINTGSRPPLQHGS